MVIQSLVCPFWATVETWRCNMADCGGGAAPSVDIKEVLV